MHHTLSPLIEPELARQWGQCLRALPLSEWEDGRSTAGAQAAAAKRNLQLPRNHIWSQTLQRALVEALNQHPRFLAAALPRRLYPPRINRYDPDHPSFDWHVDGAIRLLPDRGEPMRTDLSCTVFLSDPDTYEGGVLEIQDAEVVHRVRLRAGEAVLYPAHTLHRVTPVTAGCRVAAFFWVESLVADPVERSLLLQLDDQLQNLRTRWGETPEAHGLMGLYHQLLRRWAVA